MKQKTLSRYFSSGVVFLREHPQLWFTAFVAVLIVGAFAFTAYRFATIAQDAQEQLINVRVGSILDTFVLFAPDTLEEPDVLRARMQGIVAQNPTIERFSILAPYSATTWRLYVTLSGEREGTMVENDVPVYGWAYGQPGSAYTLERLDGGERYFMTARAIVNDAGQVVALAVTDQRLSEADRQISENLRNSMVLLGAIVLLIMVLFVRHARIVDYATLYKKQVEVDEMKDSFISMASHELKSPLSVIRGYIEFLKDGVPEEETRQEYLRRIDLSATELRQLVDDILDVSRIEMGRLRFSPDYVEPVSILEEVHEMYKGAASEKGLSIHLEVADTVRSAAVRVDAGRLKQVVVNLVSNAVKYTLAGTITITQDVVDGRLELSVRDSGVGMTAEEVSKLFGKFYRVEAKETKGTSGTGLGLWITQYIVQHMGGTVSVESIKGEGSRFIVSFPLHKTPAQ